MPVPNAFAPPLKVVVLPNVVALPQPVALALAVEKLPMICSLSELSKSGVAALLTHHGSKLRITHGHGYRATQAGVLDVANDPILTQWRADYPKINSIDVLGCASVAGKHWRTRIAVVVAGAT
jgi:hypothetical protein